MPKVFVVEHQPNAHILFFDTIRGLAALSVVGSHYVMAFGLPCQTLSCKRFWIFTPFHFLYDGFAAVSLFFVLSGIVLSLKHFRASQHADLAEFKLRDYFISRVCRIWVPYVTVLLISAILQRVVNARFTINALAASDWVISLWQVSVSLSSLASESVLLLPTSFSLIPQAWTLSIELILSLLIPLGVILASRSTCWLICFTAIAILLLGASPFLFHFAIGILISKYFQQIQAKVRIKRSLRLILLISGGFFYTIRYTVPVYLDRLFHWSISESIIWVLTGVGAALLLAFVIGSPRAQNMLSVKLLREVGKISYSIYLIHMLVLICVARGIMSQISNQTQSLLFTWLSGVVITFGMTLLLAKLSYQYVEIPTMALGKRLTNKGDITHAVLKQSCR